MTTIKLIPHDGGPCPVDGEFSAIIKDTNGQHKVAYSAQFWNWNYIIAYCQIEIEEDI